MIAFGARAHPADYRNYVIQVFSEDYQDWVDTVYGNDWPILEQDGVDEDYYDSYVDDGIQALRQARAAYPEYLFRLVKRRVTDVVIVNHEDMATPGSLAAIIH